MSNSQEEKNTLDTLFKVGLGVIILAVILFISGMVMIKKTPKIVDDKDLIPNETQVQDEIDQEDVLKSDGSVNLEGAAASGNFRIETLSLSEIDNNFRSEFFPLVSDIYSKKKLEEAQPSIDAIRSKFGDYIADEIMYAAFSRITNESPYSEVFPISLLLNGPLDEDAVILGLQYTLVVPVRLVQQEGQDFGITQNNFYKFTYFPETGVIYDVSIRVMDGEVFANE